MTVELIDHIGDDLRVVNAARVSFSKESEYESDSQPYKWSMYVGCGEHTLKEEDCRLIKYLAKHQHWTPFSHAIITLRIKMPIFIARQWFKHQIGFTRNEVSRRYVSDKPEFYEIKEWRRKSDIKKQGSTEEVIDISVYNRVNTVENSRVMTPLNHSIQQVINLSLSNYNRLIAVGVSPEQARSVLPQSMMTEFYETGSLAAYARLYKLRSSPDAQKEIQDYAKQIDKIMSELYPVCWDALINNSEFD